MVCGMCLRYGGKWAFSPSSLAKKAIESECLVDWPVQCREAARTASLSRRNSHNFLVIRSSCRNLCALTAALSVCLLSHRLLLIPVSHTSVEGLPPECGGGLKRCSKTLFLAARPKRHQWRLPRPSGPGCTQRRWL